MPYLLKFGTEPNSVLCVSAAHLGTKYEENQSIHHGGMCEDGQKNVWTDWWTGPIPIFSDSAIVEWGSIKGHWNTLQSE